MLKLFRNVLILTLIMSASCFDATGDNVTTTTMKISTLTTSTYIDASMRTTVTKEKTLLPSAIVIKQDEAISKNLSHALPSSSSSSSSPPPSLSLSSSPSPLSSSDTVWECPNITKAGVECSCDFPHTLRCTGDRTALETISDHLKHSQPDTISLLDVTVTGISVLPAHFLENVALHGLVISTGELRHVHENAFTELARPLQALGLPSNLLDSVPTIALSYLVGLDRLDLSTLTRLDLANNRIVAVSGASLAHLEKLITLDLTHNFLRALTADLVMPLKSLQDLKRLSLADNPLNCDCTLLEFANWLTNSSLTEEDKSSAVCATPPALENGILTQVPPGSLLCGEPTPPMMTRIPVADAQLSLKEFRYDETTGINLLWHVEQCVKRYTCDSLIVYETIGDNEIQTESSPLHCDSRMMRDPCILPVTIPASLHLQLGHKYRYCVVLLVPTGYNDVSLGLGCSDVIVLEKTQHQIATEDKYEREEHLRSPTSTQTSLDSYSQITSVHVNVSDKGYLHIGVVLSRAKNATSLSTCQLSITVFDEVTVVHRQRLNCSATSVTDIQVSLPGYYRVCASLDELTNIIVMSSNLVDDRERFRCVELVEQSYSRRNIEVFIIMAVIAATGVLLVILAVLGRSLARRLRHPRIQTQCFLPAQEFEITHKAHYIKLLATTKV